MNWLKNRFAERSTQIALSGAACAAAGAVANGIDWRVALGVGLQALLQALVSDKPVA